MRRKSNACNKFISVTPEGRPLASGLLLPTIKKLGIPIPRLFLTGPHLDMAPAAYPDNSLLVNDPEEARAVVNRFVDEGATALKVYFRLPLATIRAVCEAAHQRNIPVTAHLEIVRADDAIEAGLDGIEHVTSVGTAIADSMQAEKFRQAVPLTTMRATRADISYGARSTWIHRE